MSYTTPKKIFEFLNYSTKVRDESLGVGNASQTVFDISNMNIISGSERLYSSGTQLTSGFTLDYDYGKLTFSSAPSSGEIKIDYDYTDIPNSVVTTIISQSDEMIDTLTGRMFTTGSSSEIISREETQEEIFTIYYPINSITGIYENEAGEGAVYDWSALTESTQYLCNSEDKTLGRVRVIFPEQHMYGKDSFKVDYTWGYSSGSVPLLIEQLSNLLTIKTMVNNGIYKAIVKGTEAYSPVRIEQVDKSIELLINIFSKKKFSLV